MILERVKIVLLTDGVVLNGMMHPVMRKSSLFANTVVISWVLTSLNHHPSPNHQNGAAQNLKMTLTEHNPPACSHYLMETVTEKSIFSNYLELSL